MNAGEGCALFIFFLWGSWGRGGGVGRALGGVGVSRGGVQLLPSAPPLGSSTVCLVGESPTCSVPALWGCEGLWSLGYGRAW